MKPASMIEQRGDSQDLRSAWNSAAAAGKIVNEFMATGDGPAGTWRAGDRVRFGVVEGQANCALRFESLNLSTGLRIPVQVLEREVGSRGFRCQFHPFRELRPGADACPGSTGCHFWCDDASAPLSMLRRPVILRLALPNASWNAYPNAVPFQRLGHCLWIPAGQHPGVEVLPHLPQRLSQGILEDLISLVTHPVSRGCVLFFNGLGAGASVDHFHLHAMVHYPRLAVASASTLDHGGWKLLSDYPARGVVFDLDREPERSRFCQCALRLQEGRLPLNMVFVDQRAYVFIRPSSPRESGGLSVERMASIELSGTLVTGDSSVYTELSESVLCSALEAATVCPSEFLD